LYNNGTIIGTEIIFMGLKPGPGHGPGMVRFP